jgi:acyl-CoA hydrolase
MTDLAPVTPAYARSSLAVLMEQGDANLLGNVHGGVITRLVDTTAGVVAQRHSGGPAVTAQMDEMAFLAPIHVGDIVRTFAQVNWAGRTSMEIGVRVESEPWDVAGGQTLHVASAYLVFVAVDERGRSRQVPPLRCESPTELRRHREAEIRREHRLAAKALIEAGRTRD